MEDLEQLKRAHDGLYYKVRDLERELDYLKSRVRRLETK